MSRWRVYLGLSLTIIFWGASFVATKIALRVLNSASITVIRFGIGFLVIAITLLVQRKGKLVNLKDLPMLALLGFLGVPFHQWLQTTGLKTAAATVGSWFVATIPIFVAILGWLILKEPLGQRRVLGIVIATFGALAVVSQGDLPAILSGRVGTIGDFLFLLSAINWAVFTVFSRRVLRREGSSGARGSPSQTNQAHQPLNTMMFVMGFGWFFSWIWFAVDGRISDFSLLTGEYLWSILFLGVACSGLGYIFWYQALGVVDATQTGVFLYFEPIVTVLLAWPILGERISIGGIAGGAAILFGVWVVTRS